MQPAFLANISVAVAFLRIHQHCLSPPLNADLGAIAEAHVIDPDIT